MTLSVIDPGDTVLSSVVISNAIGESALNVAIREALAGMTLVPNTTNVSPLALNDAYNAAGNHPWS